MEHPERITVLDFGSQYTQLIARRIRECGVYAEILPYWTSAEELRRAAPAGIVLSGGPASVYAEGAPHPDPQVFSLGIPLLGICYGLQLLAFHLGGRSPVRRGASTGGHSSTSPQPRTSSPICPTPRPCG
jgi:GMP synthase (glutamine-hydrolysing)